MYQPLGETVSRTPIFEAAPVLQAQFVSPHYGNVRVDVIQDFVKAGGDVRCVSFFCYLA